MVNAFVHWSRDHNAQIVEVRAFASDVHAIEFCKKSDFQPLLVHLELPLKPTK